MQKKRLLFISADKDLPQCSFHELGLSLYEFLQKCNSFDTTFFNSGSRTDPYPSIDINKEFDLVVFNYHFQVMAYMPIEFFDSITVPKIMINYETRSRPWNSPCHIGSKGEHFGVAGEPQRRLFNYMIIPDSTMSDEGDPTVLTLPRVTPRRVYTKRPVNMDNPIISTYGLPSADKNVIGMYRAICDEFDKATFRVHFATDSRSSPGLMQNMFNWCINNPKEGITLQWSEDFIPHDQVPDWLNESDLNIFFYDSRRDMVTEGTFPGSMDFAITAQRPIAVSNNLCTRYITKYIDPWPKKSLKEIMAQCPIDQIYSDGDPITAANKLDNWIMEKFG